MKNLLFLSVLISQVAFSQLGTHKDLIFKQENQNYFEKVEFEGYTVYNFIGKIEKSIGGDCPEIVSYFIYDKTENCFQVNYNSCSEAVNTYVKFLNKIAVEIGHYKWKDYQNNSVYKLEVNGKFCSVHHYWEKI